MNVVTIMGGSVSGDRPYGGTTSCAGFVRRKEELVRRLRYTTSGRW